MPTTIDAELFGLAYLATEPARQSREPKTLVEVYEQGTQFVTSNGQVMARAWASYSDLDPMPEWNGPKPEEAWLLDDRDKRLKGLASFALGYAKDHPGSDVMIRFGTVKRRRNSRKLQLAGTEGPDPVEFAMVVDGEVSSSEAVRLDQVEYLLPWRNYYKLDRPLGRLDSIRMEFDSLTVLAKVAKVVGGTVEVEFTPEKTHPFSWSIQPPQWNEDDGWTKVDVEGLVTHAYTMSARAEQAEHHEPATTEEEETERPPPVRHLFTVVVGEEEE